MLCNFGILHLLNAEVLQNAKLEEATADARRLTSGLFVLASTVDGM